MVAFNNNYLADYEDSGGFSGDVVSQNKALANIVNPKPAGPSQDVIDALKNQILSQGTSSKWTGQGFGSAEANAADMAKILAGIGITDIKQFGPITTTVPGYTTVTEAGEEVVPEQTITTYGNKETGQVVPNTYSERQTGNMWGGTFSGKGNTGYGVQFDAQGNPHFYTQGASSNDLVNLFKDDPLLGAIAQVGAAYFGGPAGSAALAAAMGKDPVDILKSAALSYAGGQAANAVSGIEGITDVLGKTGTNIAANAAKQVVSSGGQVDPVQALIGGATDFGINQLISEIPDLNAAVPKELKGVATDLAKAAINGKPLDQALINSVVRQVSSGSSPSSSNGEISKDFIESERARLTSEGASKDEIKNYLQNLDRLSENLDYEPEKVFDPSSFTTSSPQTRSLAGTQTEEADDFLKSIGINTLDKATDSGLSNQDILDMIGAGNDTVDVTGQRNNVGAGMSNDILENLQNAKADEGVVVTGKRDTVGSGMSNDILENLQNAQADEGVVITGNRDTVGRGMSNDILENLQNAQADEGVVITGNRDKTQEHVFDPTFGGALPRDEGEVFITGNRDKTQEHVFDPTFGGTLPLDNEEVVVTAPAPAQPETTTSTPTKPATPAKTTNTATASTSSSTPYQEQAPQAPRWVTPELANVFYYGKDFGSKKQKLNEFGELEQEDYRGVGEPVTAADGGLVADQKNRENNANDALDLILGQSGYSMSVDDLLNIVKGS